MKDYCCDALKQALAEQILYEPIQTVEKKTPDGKVFVDMRVLPPSIEGKPITHRSKKRRPTFILAYCPFCGKRFEEPHD